MEITPMKFVSHISSMITNSVLHYYSIIINDNDWTTMKENISNNIQSIYTNLQEKLILQQKQINNYIQEQYDFIVTNIDMNNKNDTIMTFLSIAPGIAVIVILVIFILLFYIIIFFNKRNKQRNLNLNRRPSVEFASTMQQHYHRARTRSYSYDSTHSYNMLDTGSNNHESNYNYNSSRIGSIFASARSLLSTQPNTATRNRTTSTSSLQRRNSNGSMNTNTMSMVMPSSSDLIRDTDILEDVDLNADHFALQMLGHNNTSRIAQQQKRNKRRRKRFQSKDTYSDNNNTLIFKKSKQHLKLRGPTVHTIEYSTLTPPPTWTEASRNILVSNSANDWTLSRKVILELLSNNNNYNNNNNKIGTATGTLIIKEPYSDDYHRSNNKSKQQLKDLATKNATGTSKKKSATTERVSFIRSIMDCSIHVHRPVEGGILELYVKQTERKEWMEHTFYSSSNAAQFQLDFLSLQILGPSIHNMYQALALIHQGSDAYILNNDEPVLHYQTKQKQKQQQSSNTEQEDNNKNSDENAAANNTNNTESNGNLDSKEQEDDEDSRPVIAEDSGIAWDDVMRCLGSSFPSIRLRLEAMWWYEIHGGGSDNEPTQYKSKNTTTNTTSTTTATTSSDDKKPQPDENKENFASSQDSSTYLKPEYMNMKRLILGPVDFFRLFVPKLSDTSVPECESSRQRMEQMLRWRKRVARASVLVQSYVRAKTICNRGWQLGYDPTKYSQHHLSLPGNYLRRRLAFDDNEDNKLHDAATKNVYYEATVSKDVICHVRSADFYKSQHCWWMCGLDTAPVSALSSYQAYSLVGIHAFHFPVEQEHTDDIDNLPLHYKKDPVKCIPSLRTLIEKHPSMDFFVVAFFVQSRKAAIVHVYVRSLPRGIDPNFDTVIDRFTNGDENLRKRKLEAILQLGVDSTGMTLLGRLMFWWLSILLRVSLRGRYVPQPASTSDHTSLPAMNLAECGDTYHFGGALRSDERLPHNYVASTVHMQSQRNNSIATRMLLGYIELGGLSMQVTDFSFVIAGEESDELPERVMCSARIVRNSMSALHLSSVSSNGNSSGGQRLQVIEAPEKLNRGGASLYVKIFITDPVVATVMSLVRSSDSIRNTRFHPTSPIQSIQNLIHRSPRSKRQARVDESMTDPFEKAVNELIVILEDIKVPIRKDQVLEFEPANASIHTKREAPFTLLPTTSVSTNDDLRQSEITHISILHLLNRYDIQRFFIASKCSLKTAAVRLVESAVWRGLTFPIDTRMCRVELQNGQFFQQGTDREGRPVFYFRNMCLGPWRKDEDAVIAAVLYRLEARLNELSREDPYVQCTIIIPLGKPYKRKTKKVRNDSDYIPLSSKKLLGKDDKIDQTTIASTAAMTDDREDDDDESEDEEDEEDDDDSTYYDEDVDYEEAARLAQINNPRVYRDELWHVHTSRTLIERLINILLTHYPERLANALVVVRHGNIKYIRTAAGGVLSLASVVRSSRTRDKVRFLTRYRDLRTYVERSELVTMVGGTQIEDCRHFENTY